jgi:hypothetical protein
MAETKAAASPHDFAELGNVGLVDADLLNFQQHGLDYLYDLEPTQNNLFWAGNFSDHDDTTGADSSDKTKNTRTFDNAQYRIRSIKLELPKLEFEEHKQLHINLIKSVTYTKQVTITWIDDVYRSVQKYHLDWYTRWYNRELDCLRCGTDGKFRGLDVVLFHYREANTTLSSPLLTVPVPEPILRLRLRGMVPKDIGSIEFDMSNAGNDGALSITYALSLCSIDYWKPLQGNSYPTSENSSDIKAGIWSPTTGDADSEFKGESYRIARAVTKAIAAEGALA